MSNFVAIVFKLFLKVNKGIPDNIADKLEKLIGEDKVWAWGHVWSAIAKGQIEKLSRI